MDRGTRAGSWYTGIFNCRCIRSSEEGEKPGSQGWFPERRILLNGGVLEGHTRLENPRVGTEG